MATYVSWATKTPRDQNYNNALFCVKIFRQSKFDRDRFGLKVLIHEIPRCLQHKRNTVSNVSRTTAPLLKHGLKMFFMNILSVSPNFQLLLKIVSPTGPSPVDIINPEALSIQQKIPVSSNFRNSMFPERNGRSRLNSRYGAFGYRTCNQDTEERY